MNPYAGLYLQVDRQRTRDLAAMYQHAQRGWANPEFSDSEYRPVKKSRIAAALRRLRRRQSATPVTPLPTASAPVAEPAAEARIRAHAA